MRGQVLLARRFIGIGSCGVLAICHQRSTMTARKLFVARVSIINRDDEASPHRGSEA